MLKRNGIETVLGACSKRGEGDLIAGLLKRAIGFPPPRGKESKIGKVRPTGPSGEREKEKNRTRSLQAKRAVISTTEGRGARHFISRKGKP